MAARVFLHVGCPKTGTTFLQQVLWSQRELAKEQGLLLPLGGVFAHYQASLIARGQAAKLTPDKRGLWKKLVAEVADWPHDALVSHELFAAATVAQAAHVVGSFEAAEVHVVLTARDLQRQIPAEWQEHVKHRSVTSYADFVRAVVDRTPNAEWFWKVQGVADVMARWRGDLPARQLHLVTVPPRGSDPTVLWQRFAGVVGLDPSAFDLEAGRSNVSLGAEQVQVLRSVNARLGDRLKSPGAYSAVVKDVFSHEVLAAQHGAPFGFPADQSGWVARRSQRMVQALSAADYDVVGDLSELTPATDDELPDQVDPDVFVPRAVLESAAEALADLLDRHHQLADDNRALRAELDQARRESAQATRLAGELRARERDLETEAARRKSRPVRQLAIDISERHRVTMLLRRVYWKCVNTGRRIRRR